MIGPTGGLERVMEALVHALQIAVVVKMTAPVTIRIYKGR